MNPDQQFQLVLGLGCVVLGIALDRLIIFLSDRRARAETKALLARELKGNVSRLDELQGTIDEYPGSLGLTEIGARILAACERESFETCRRDLPTLGNDAMGRVFAFYDHTRSTAFAFSEIENWQGNIRATLIDDHLDHLRALAAEAMSALV